MRLWSVLLTKGIFLIISSMAAVSTDHTSCLETNQPKAAHYSTGILTSTLKSSNVRHF